MQSIIEKLGNELYRNGSHIVYKISWYNISPLCNKWSKNRESDPERIKEMYSYHMSGGYIPWFLHLAEVKNEGLVCYDGNHRREVLHKIGNDQECIIDVMFNASNKEVFTAFNSINLSVQVPSLYFDQNNDPEIKQEIIDLVKEYEKKYPAFLSTSPRCHAPHFNRDTFVEAIYNIYNIHNGELDIHLIKLFLDKLNYLYSVEEICKPHNSFKTSIIEKCKKYGLWLFIHKQIQLDHFEKVIS